MAIIEFEPTWISVFRDGERVRTSEPIEIASRNLGNDPYDAQSAIGFDAQKILDFINYSETPAHVYFAYDIVNYIDGGIFINRFTGDETVTENGYVGTSTGVRFRNFQSQVLLDELTVGGESLTFKEALESSYTGLGFRKSGTLSSGIGEYENIAILLEGEWVINAPSNLSPSGGILQNDNEPIVFNWDHNGSFEQRTFELRYRLVGGSDWNTFTEETSNQEYELASLEIGEYEWQVRTTTDYDYESSWSSLSVFQVAETTPTPVIIIPSNNDVIEISDLTVEWESENQHEYELEVLQDGAVIARRTGGSGKSLIIADILENNTSYAVNLRVNQENGIWSSWATALFSVKYTEPAQPQLTFLTNADESTITIYINNPTPGGTQPNIVSQDLYRVEPSGEIIRIAKDLNPNDYFVDYTPAHEINYAYYVRLFGENEVNVNSNRYSASVEVKHVLINLTSDLSQTVRLKMDPEKSFDTSYSATTRVFSGRRKPVTEFGEAIEQSGTASFTVDKDTPTLLYEFLNRQETLLYRDSRGRKQFITISDISVSDQVRHIDLFSVSLTLTEVDYSEAVL